MIRQRRGAPLWVRRLPHLAPAMLLRSPLHRVLSRRFLLLSYSGRRTGRRYTLPVAYCRRGQDLLVTTTGSWWRNFTAPAPVRVRLSGLDQDGIALASQDPDEVTEALRRLVRGQPSYASFAAIRCSADGTPDPDSLRRAARERALVRIRLGTPEGSAGRRSAGTRGAGHPASG